MDNGTLSGGTIAVQPAVVCIGDAITFTLTGVIDSGGIKRVNCTAKQAIPPVSLHYSWLIVKPDGTVLGGQGSVATVTANAPGAYQCTFSAAALRDCPPPPLVIGPAMGKGFKIEVIALTFQSDHALMHDNYTDYEPTGNLFAQPEWFPTWAPPRNFPISHSMDQHVALQLDVKVTLSDGTALAVEIAGAGGAPGFNFAASGLRGGLNFLNLTSTDRIDRRIAWLTPSIGWSFTHEGSVCHSETTGPHTVYVTMGTPRGVADPRHMVTVKRMERAVTQAGAANSVKPHEIVKTVIQAQGNFRLGRTFANAWLVPDDGGDCQMIVRFTEKVAKMINVSGTFDHRKIYAKPAAPDVAIEGNPDEGGLNTDPAFHATEPWYAALLDANGGCNAFEAVVKFSACGETRFYPGGTTGIFSNKDDVLRVFRRLSWVTVDAQDVCTEHGVIFPYPPAPPNAPMPLCSPN